MFSKLGIDELRGAGQVGQHEIAVKNQEQKVEKGHLSKKAEALILTDPVKRIDKALHSVSPTLLWRCVCLSSKK